MGYLLCRGKTDVFFESYKNCDDPLSPIAPINRTIIHLACEMGNSRVITHLLQDQTINFEELDRLGESPFMVACRSGNFKVKTM